MSIVRGEQVLISFYNGTTIAPFACSRSITLNLTSDIINKSTIGSGNWKEKEKVALDWNFSIEGITYLQLDGYCDFEDVINFWLNMSAIVIQCIVTDGTNTVTLGGFALITNVSQSGTVNSPANTNITGEGTGQLFVGDIIYGNYPTSFFIFSEHPDTPTAGQTTLNFSWADGDPLPESYIIQINDLTDDTIDHRTGITDMHKSIVVDSTHTYSFAIASVYFGGAARSEYSPLINWP